LKLTFGLNSLLTRKILYIYLTEGKIELVALKKFFSKLHVIALQQVDLSKLSILSGVIYNPTEISQKISEFVVVNGMKNSSAMVASSIFTTQKDESLLRCVTLQLWLCLNVAKVCVRHILPAPFFDLQKLCLNEQVFLPDITNQHDYLADIVQKRDWRFNLILLLGISFLIGALFFIPYVHFNCNRELAALVSERKRLELVTQRAKITDKDLSCLQKACSDQEKLLIKLQKLGSQKPNYSLFLQNVSQDIPALVWLTDFWMAGQRIKISGLAVNAHDITAFVGRLSKVPQIEKIALVDLQEKRAAKSGARPENRAAYRFSIEGTLQR